MSQSLAIRRLVVVGGGTAGWLSASWLARALGPAGRCTVTLVESPDIATVGVGEATIDSLPDTLAYLGCDEWEWMKHCQATFKLAVRFVNWSGGGDDDVFWHPFGDLPMTSTHVIPRHQAWLTARAGGHEGDVYGSCFEAVALARRGLAPKSWDDPSFEGRVDYGYQLDAALLADFLSRRARAEGIEHVLDTVEDVVLDERGFIRHVVTREHGNIEGDLFIDCTGFRGRLVRQAMGEPWIDYGDRLPCDRAVAMRVPRATVADPYTSATALSSGWMWTIPLARRDGTGYVYDSRFLTPEAAERELRARLGSAAEGLEARHIAIRVGKVRDTWTKNCVAVGLAGGFIEPLESTGIALIELGLEYLVQHLSDRRFDPVFARRYNAIMTRFYEEIRDFLVMHYCLTRRRDTPFWRACAEHPAVPDGLRERLNRWETMWPNNIDPPGVLFPDYSYACILAGHGRVPSRPLPYLDHVDPKRINQVLKGVSTQADQLVRTLPTHGDLLRQIHGP